MYLPLHEHLSQSPYFGQILSKKEELWRFSPLKSYWERHYHDFSSLCDLPNETVSPEYDLILNNGHLLSSHLPDGTDLRIKRDQRQRPSLNPFAAFASENAPSPIEITFYHDSILRILLSYGTQALITSSIRFIIPEDINVEIHITYQGGQESFIAHNESFDLAKNAKLLLTHVKNISDQGTLISQTDLLLEPFARCQNYLLSLQGEYLHHFLYSDLKDHSEIDARSLLLPHHASHHIYSAILEHTGGESISHLLSKQAIEDTSISVVQALTRIHEHTHSVQAKQGSHALLLSSSAHAHAMPHLEIYNDDLKASHGSTVGQLDPQAIAYLCSRGIGEAEAKAILIAAFLEETTLNLKEGPVKTDILRLIGERYETHSR